MQKLTIFFIGATVVVVVSITAILGYKFFIRGEETPKETIQEEEIQEPIVVSETPAEIPEEKPTGETDTPIIIESDNTSPFATIDKNKLTEAGFSNPELNLSPFGGIIFESIDIKEYVDDEHISYRVTDEDEFAGTINELMFPSQEIASEVYASVKQKITDNADFVINETNQYGDMSFFSNNTEQKNSVFLVVKLYDRLYTLHYPAKNHNKMKNLINLL